MAAKKAVTEKTTVTIRLVKSLIGAKKDQLATAEALGLRRIGDSVCQPDNAATKGKVTKLRHLIEVIGA